MAKSKSQTWELYGKFRWAKIFPQNREMKGPEGTDFSEHDGMYMIDVVVDESNLALFEQSGSNWKIYGVKKSEREKFNLEDGEFLIRPRRKHIHHIPVFGGPPVVVMADGRNIDPANGMGVGNGSEGYIQFTTYNTTLQVGSRLDGVQVIKWVEYPLASGGGGANFLNRGETTVIEREEEEEETSTPPKKTASAKKAKAPVDEDLDDEIPF